MNGLYYRQVLVESCLETYDASIAAIKSSVPYDFKDKMNFVGLLQIHISSALLVRAKAYQGLLLQSSKLPPNLKSWFGQAVENSVTD